MNFRVVVMTVERFAQKDFTTKARSSHKGSTKKTVRKFAIVQSEGKITGISLTSAIGIPL